MATTKQKNMILETCFTSTLQLRKTFIDSYVNLIPGFQSMVIVCAMVGTEYKLLIYPLTLYPIIVIAVDLSTLSTRRS